MADGGKDAASDPALEPTVATGGETADDPGPVSAERTVDAAFGDTMAASGDGDAMAGGDAVLAEAAPERYVLADEIGRGGLGTVVRARDRHLGRQVAIKALHAEGGSARRRFVREALITARLEHPSIVPVHDAGRWQDGSPFYAMKLVRGRPLAAVIDERKDLAGRLALVPTVLAVADAVAYAHSERVVHRDLKPHNVLVGEFGETVVIDWGLAKDLGSADDHDADARALAAGSTNPGAGASRSSAPSPSRSRSTETVAGAVLGTPAYMAPEQALGDAVDERADVYALGALLYHVLVGRPPHDGGSIDEVLDRAVTGAVVPLTTREPGVPRDLAAIVAKAMAREPARRYPSARELAEDLRRFQTGQLVGAHRYTLRQRAWRWLRRNRAIAITVAAAVAASAIVASISLRDVLRSRDQAAHERDNAIAESTRADQERTSAQAAGNRAVLAQARAALARDPAETLAWLATLSIDGPGWDAARAIAADALWRGPPERVLRGHHGTPRGLAVAGTAHAVSWDDGAVWLWDLAAGAGRSFAVTRTHEAVLCADGARILGQGVRPDGAISDFTIELSSSGASGGPAVVFGKVSAAEQTRCGNPPAPQPDDCFLVAATPDGQTIACGDPSVSVRHGPGGAPHVLDKHPVRLLAIDDDGRWIAVDHDDTIDVYEVATGKKRWTIPSGPTRQVAFSPGGDALLVVSERGQIWDLVRGGGRRFGDDSILAAAYLSDGRIATIGSDRAVRLWSLRAQPPQQDGDVTAAAFTHDGASLVLGGKDGGLRRLEHDRVVATATVPAAVKAIAIADDQSIAVAVAGGDVWTWRPPAPPVRQGAHPEARQATGEANEVAWLGGDVVSWSGETVRIFATTATGAPTARDITLPPLPPPPALTDTPGDILVMPGCAAPAGAAATLVVAPGARWLAVTRNTMNGCDQLTYLVDPAAGTAALLDGSAGHRPAFTPDGRALVTSSPDGAIRIWDVATRTSRRIDAHVAHPHGAAVSADGRRVAISGEGAVALADLDAPAARMLDVEDPGLLGVWFDDADRTLAVATDDGAWIWDLASGEHRGLAIGLPLALHAGGDELAAVAGGRVWRIRDDLPRTPAELARRLTGLGYALPAATP